MSLVMGVTRFDGVQPTHEPKDFVDFITHIRELSGTLVEGDVYTHELPPMGNLRTTLFYLKSDITVLRDYRHLYYTLSGSSDATDALIAQNQSDHDATLKQVTTLLKLTKYKDMAMLNNGHLVVTLKGNMSKMAKVFTNNQPPCQLHSEITRFH